MTFVIHYIPASKDVNNKKHPCQARFSGSSASKMRGGATQLCVARLGKEQKGNQAVA